MLKNRRHYMRRYRSNYGDKMKVQIKGWWQDHPEYYREWRDLHPGYHFKWQLNHQSHYLKTQQRWRQVNKEKYNTYMKDYMREYRQ